MHRSFEIDPGIAAWAKDMGLPEDTPEEQVLDAMAAEWRRRGRRYEPVSHCSPGGPAPDYESEARQARERRKRNRHAG